MDRLEAAQILHMKETGVRNVLLSIVRLISDKMQTRGMFMSGFKSHNKQLTGSAKFLVSDLAQIAGGKTS